MAIKVNGTTVINDSRALTNIASVDATTAAAIGAAGVGGGWSLISETAITSSVHYIDVTFPSGYLEYIVEFPRLFGATTSTFQPLLQLFNASGSLVTTYQGYRSATKGNVDAVGSDYHALLATFYSGSTNTAALKLHFFNNPRSGNTRTMANTYANAGPAGEMQNGRFSMKDHGANNGMRLYSQWGTGSGPITSASHDYKIWGIK
jgi:hypothetical protein